VRANTQQMAATAIVKATSHGKGTDYSKMGSSVSSDSVQMV
jgi:hypothetical protein